MSSDQCHPSICFILEESTTWMHSRREVELGDRSCFGHEYKIAWFSDRYRNTSAIMMTSAPGCHHRRDLSRISWHILELAPASLRSSIKTCHEGPSLFVAVMRRAIWKAAENASVPFRSLNCVVQRHALPRGRRSIQISTTPSGASPSLEDFVSEPSTTLDNESPGKHTRHSQRYLLMLL